MTVHLRTATSIVLLAFGCTDSTGGDSDPSGNSTLVDDTSALACSQAQSITWDTYAHGFFLSWCTSCHSSTLPGPKRQGAPVGMDFDTYAGVVEYADKIEYRAVTAEEKYLMPPIGGPDPKERELLGLWIACGLKEQ
jgi:uncharacterized membrane protein